MEQREEKSVILKISNPRHQEHYGVFKQKQGCLAWVSLYGKKDFYIFSLRNCFCCCLTPSSLEILLKLECQMVNSRVRRELKGRLTAYLEGNRFSSKIKALFMFQPNQLSSIMLPTKIMSFVSFHSHMDQTLLLIMNSPIYKFMLLTPEKLGV